MENTDFVNNYSNFYENTISVLNNTIFSLEKSPNTDDSLKKCTNQAINELYIIKNKLNAELNVYKTNSNWDTFSIALYGETNAGKSTIIETLRILLNEKTKLEERKQFNKEKMVYDNQVKQKNDTFEKISDLEEQLKQENAKLEELKNNDVLDKYIDDWIANQLIVWYKNYNILEKMCKSFINFVRVAFNKTNEQNDLIVFKDKLLNIKNAYEKEHNAKEEKIESYYNSINEIILEINELNEKNEQLNIEISNTLDVLKKYSDGNIIGDDIDFTKESREYEFNINNIKFSLFDLPGIEGKEENVQEEIKKALATAHVVLYISSKQRMPQKGDNSSKGTIEKISEQLSAQAEVYFIFNKRILNPIQIAEQLETPEDKQSLIAVDNGMKEIMPKNYMGSKIVSAYPTFVSICDNLDGTYFKSKDKFLAKFSKDEILVKSGVKDFIDWIINDLASNASNKIICSNFNKIIYCNNLAVDVANEYINNLQAYKKDVENDLKDVRELLKSAKNNYIKSISNYLSKYRRQYITSIRKEMYVLIENGIDNSELSKKTKEKLKKFEKASSKDVMTSINSYSDVFKDDVQKIVNKHSDYVKTINDLYTGKFNTNNEYSFELDIPTKGSIVKTVLSIVSLVVSIIISPDHGVIAAILGIGSALLSFGKEVISFFDNDYKISQQKNGVDKQLAVVSENIEDRIKDFKKEISDEIDIKYDELYGQLDLTIDSIKELLRIIMISRNDILNEIDNLKREEENLYECN